MRYGNLIYKRPGMSSEVYHIKGARLGTVTREKAFRNRWTATRCNGEVLGTRFETKLAAAVALGER